MKLSKLSLQKLLIVTVFTLGSVIFIESAHPALTPSPTDAQTIGIVETINNGEIAASELVAKSPNEDVRKLAQDMIAGHTQLNNDVEKIAHRFNLKKDESALGVKLKADSALKQTELKMLHDENLDKKYVDAMVDGHQSALEAFDQTLIPSAQNPQLKSALIEARKSVADHLAHARRVQGELK